MKKRLTALALAALLALSLTGCARSGGEEETEEPKPGTAVEVTAVERGDIYNESTVTGSVMANRDIPIMPPVSGRVKDVAVKAGDQLKLGAAKTGCRAYIAFAGGLDVDPAKVPEIMDAACEQARALGRSF